MRIDNRKQHLWLFVRVCLVAASAAIPWLEGIPEDPDYAHSAPFYFPPMLAAITTLGLSFVIMMNGLNGNRNAWIRPSWIRRPFVGGQPLEFFHFAAWCTISYSTGCFLFFLMESKPNWFWEIPLAMGIGMWLGVRLNLPKKSIPK